MMKYLCTHCNYIYDEILGEVEDWISPWTKLSSMQDIFTCPSCYESIDNFQEIREQINSFDTDKNIIWIEYEHFPFIEKWEDWFIKIEVKHPNEESHFLWNIWIYDEYWDIVYEEFFKPWEPASLEFDVSDLDEYEVRTGCSLHWVFSKKFEN